MRDVVDLERYPLDRLDGPAGEALVAACRRALEREGMFDLDGFLTEDARAAALGEVARPLRDDAFTHRRAHNIYFRKDVPGLAPDHPALAERETVNHTICADQIEGSILRRLYDWPPFAAFLARVMGEAALYPMGDPLAGVNVMAYREGEALNWHFDRSEFTTTLLLQAPEAGGGFEYRKDLRTEDDPNHDGVARLLRGEDPLARIVHPAPGGLNVFKGRNTPHRVTPVEGGRERVIAVFSFYDRPGVAFSDEERIGFYGRAG